MSQYSTTYIVISIKNTLDTCSHLKFKMIDDHRDDISIALLHEQIYSSICNKILFIVILNELRKTCCVVMRF